MSEYRTSRDFEYLVRMFYMFQWRRRIPVFAEIVSSCSFDERPSMNEHINALIIEDFTGDMDGGDSQPVCK